MKGKQETVRSFIAIELTDEARGGLARLQRELKEILPQNTVRWTLPENIHLTLHFLGDVALDDADEISRAVCDVSATHTPFSLDLSSLGCFPNTRRPRIIWVGLSGETDTLGALQKKLGERLNEAVGFQPESRSYSPHLTIGRLRKAVTKQQQAQLGRSLEQEIPGVGHLARLPVDHIHFIRSDLKPDGPIYTSITKAELGQLS
jgi:2'-5' RNA ligase